MPPRSGAGGRRSDGPRVLEVRKPREVIQPAGGGGGAGQRADVAGDGNVTIGIGGYGNVVIVDSSGARGSRERMQAADGRAAAHGVPWLDLGRLPVPGQRFVGLVGRSEELRRLDAAWENPRIHVLSLVAFGGMGKSALVSAWLDKMAAAGWCGAERVLDWSFYTQGSTGETASAEPFLLHALGSFGDPDPGGGSPYDRGFRLAGLVRRQRTLLVLDGLEPLQHGPGPVEGKLKDPGLAALLKGLAAANPGLCLVTTRVPVRDLTASPETAPQDQLGELAVPAAVELLQRLGVTGREAELRAAVGEWSRDALTLTLLGNYLRRACGGDVRRRREVDLGKVAAKEGGHAMGVMAACTRFLGEGTELAVLRLLGLFDRPADGASLGVLRAAPPIAGLTDRIVDLSAEDWNSAVSSLREYGLLAGADARQPESLDAHPLVRAYLAGELTANRPRAWQAANLRLYEHLRQAAPDLPETLAAMQPLYAAVVHGCRAGRRQEALDEIFYRRIQRGDLAFSTNALGAYGGDLTALAGFFEQPWKVPARELSRASQAFVLTIAGVLLRGLGRLVEAVEPTRVALESAVALQDWLHASCAAGNLSDLTLALGGVARAEELGRESVELAERSGNEAEMRYNLGVLATALHQASREQESMATFRRANALRRASAEPPQPTPYYYSVASYEYCDLLLGRAWPHEGAAPGAGAGEGRRGEAFRRACREVVRRAGRSLRVATKNRWLRDAALDSLCLGRAHLGMALMARQGGAEAALGEAADHLDRSVGWLRQAGQENDLPRGLVARAELRRVRGEPAGAASDLAEALEIAERGSMRLLECDAHLEWTRLCERQGAAGAAREHLARVRQLVAETGYRRREREMEELQALLG
jgi:hypothetical protein